MQYLLLLYGDEKLSAKMTPEELGHTMGAYRAYTSALQDSGVYIGGNPLQSTETATCVRGAGNQARVADGPYAETKEQLGGYYLIDAPNLDAALEWAKRCPASEHGCVEVRPIRVFTAEEMNGASQQSAPALA
ncbi:MAG TPA: YciI family protein [Bryobacteraceae bacterium]|jgi:hypothetical protein|nr:YciI family protein [Bryobacteraceae bacterium]